MVPSTSYVKTCESWSQKLSEHNSVLAFEALGAHMSSKIDEEMLFQNMLHRCLVQVKKFLRWKNIGDDIRSKYGA